MSIDTITEAPPSLFSDKWTAGTSLSESFIAPSTHSHRTRVLIFEENGEMRDHFNQFLGAEFDLVVVSNTEDAVTAACMSPFNIIVQDIEHEREFEAVMLSKQLRQLRHCKDAHFISITGYVLPEGKAVLKRAHFDYHMAKPFTLRRLRDILRLCVAKQTLSILNGINVELDLPIGTTMAVMMEM